MLDILLKDAAGQPVKGAELAVVVVDEAVLALTGYQTPDPLGVFYSVRSPDTTDYHLRSNLALANPNLPASGAAQAAIPGALDRSRALALAPQAADAAPAAPLVMGAMRAGDRRGCSASTLYCPAHRLQRPGSLHAYAAHRRPRQGPGRSETAR